MKDRALIATGAVGVVLAAICCAAPLLAVTLATAALDPLYASFSDEQKKLADGVTIGPMGVM